MRKVIFIGGTAYSGSTFLDMTLANSSSGFSCGEVYALFKPFRRHHFKYDCGCGNISCNIWDTLKKGGVNNLYQNIFNYFPNVQYIIDSSKDPLWIYDRSIDLINQGISVSNVLIWKTPEEFFDSLKKRGQEKNWYKAWVNYHKLYFRMVDSWYSVSYSAFTQSVESLKLLCECQGIGYFSEKHRYWEKKHHTLFGNSSAKIHLHELESDAYTRTKEELTSNFDLTFLDRFKESETHRTIHYKSPMIHNLNKQNNEKKIIIDNIVQVLIKTDITRITKNEYTEKDKYILAKKVHNLKASKTYELYRRTKRDLLSSGFLLCEGLLK